MKRSDGFSEMDRWDPQGFQADGDGLWFRPIVGRLGASIGIRFTDMAEHISESEMRESGCLRYEAQVVLVDLNAIPEAEQKSARESCGWEDMPETDRARAEMCIRYGLYAPLGTHCANNLRTVLRGARREAKELIRDPSALDLAMDQPVNRLGSTAREFMTGDLDSALSRGLAEGQTNARIMTQMSRPVPQGPVAVTVRLGAVPSDDPLPYMMGFLGGFKGLEMTEDRVDLAPAYLAGRTLGADVRLGRQPVPGWVR